MVTFCWILDCYESFLGHSLPGDSCQDDRNLGEMFQNDTWIDDSLQDVSHLFASQLSVVIPPAALHYSPSCTPGSRTHPPTFRLERWNIRIWGYGTLVKASKVHLFGKTRGVFRLSCSLSWRQMWASQWQLFEHLGQPMSSSPVLPGWNTNNSSIPA